MYEDLRLLIFGRKDSDDVSRRIKHLVENSRVGKILPNFGKSKQIWYSGKLINTSTYDKTFIIKGYTCRSDK